MHPFGRDAAIVRDGVAGAAADQHGDEMGRWRRATASKIPPARRCFKRCRKATGKAKRYRRAHLHFGFWANTAAKLPAELAGADTAAVAPRAGGTPVPNTSWTRPIGGDHVGGLDAAGHRLRALAKVAGIDSASRRRAKYLPADVDGVMQPRTTKASCPHLDETPGIHVGERRQRSVSARLSAEVPFPFDFLEPFDFLLYVIGRVSNVGNGLP